MKTRNPKKGDFRSRGFNFVLKSQREIQPIAWGLHGSTLRGSSRLCFL
jgi:hypothetical protein